MRLLAAERGNGAFGGAWLAVNAVVGARLQQAPHLLRLPDRAPTQALVGGFSGRAIGLIFATWGAAFVLGIAGWSLFVARWPRSRCSASRDRWRP